MNHRIRLHGIPNPNGARNHVSFGVHCRFLLRNAPHLHQLHHIGMVCGEGLHLLFAKKVSSAVPHIGNIKLLLAHRRCNDGCSHFRKLPVGIGFFINHPICSCHRTCHQIQHVVIFCMLHFLPEMLQKAFDCTAARDFSRVTAAHPIGNQI